MGCFDKKPEELEREAKQSDEEVPKDFRIRYPKRNTFERGEQFVSFPKRRKTEETAVEENEAKAAVALPLSKLTKDEIESQYNEIIKEEIAERPINGKARLRLISAMPGYLLQYELYSFQDPYLMGMLQTLLSDRVINQDRKVSDLLALPAKAGKTEHLATVLSHY